MSGVGEQHTRGDGGARLRIRFWNVAGTLGEVCEIGDCGRRDGGGVGSGSRGLEGSHISDVLEGVEVLVLSETGFVGNRHAASIQNWCSERGWERVVCSMRPYEAKCGGVAVFVKKRRGPRLPGEPRVQQVEAKVVRDQPELGVAWVQLRVGGSRWIYMGACYLPPKASTYYQREGGGKGQEGGLSADRHWWALGEAVREFSQRGEVLLVGDLNCRLGGSYRQAR